MSLKLGRYAFVVLKSVSPSFYDVVTHHIPLHPFPPLVFPHHYILHKINDILIYYRQKLVKFSILYKIFLKELIISLQNIIFWRIKILKKHI